MGHFTKKKVFLDTARAKELYDMGWCDPQIADECGVGRDTVRAWRKRNNLEGHKAPPKPKKQKKHVSNIAAIEAEAREHNTSYGQHYMATRGSFFEQKRRVYDSATAGHDLHGNR